jgi:hypothetical protein
MCWSLAGLVIEFAMSAVKADKIVGILDGRVPPPRRHEVEAVARIAKIPAECVRPHDRARPIMSEVVVDTHEARLAGGHRGHARSLPSSRMETTSWRFFLLHVLY